MENQFTVHTLQRAIYFGGIPVARERRQDELVAISGSLTLLTNLAMAWTTHKLQGVLNHRGRRERPVPGPGRQTENSPLTAQRQLHSPVVGMQLSLSGCPAKTCTTTPQRMQRHHETPRVNT